jgi:hypothetical protein
MSTLTRRTGRIGLLVATLSASLALPTMTHAAVDAGSRARHPSVSGVHQTVFTIRTGPGPHDKIRLHHIVRERHGRPVRTESAVLLLHGDAWGYDAAFVNEDHRRRSMPAYLARHGVDVWGLDLGWTLVPAGTENLDFMAEWGLQHDVDDVSRALAFARRVRAHSGSGKGPVTLGAWSRGAWIGYSLLSQETQQPRAQRQVGAFVSMDNFYKTDDPVSRDAQCAIAEENDGYLADGDYFYDYSATADIGRLAETDPDGESPYWGPPYTNAGASLSYGAAGFQGEGYVFSPWYHFVGGTFPNGDTSRDPDGLRFTSFSDWNNFLMGVGSFEPVRLVAEAARITCDDGTTGRFDAHLDDIRVPILYVGAAGGFGTYGLHAMELTASHDTDSLIARALPPGQEERDLGHVDLFHARDAQRFAWHGVLRWLHDHPTTSALR